MQRSAPLGLLLSLLIALTAPGGGAAAADYNGLFPPPLSGWTAGAIEAKESRETIGGESYARIRLSRLYSGPDGARVALTVDTLDCMRAAAIERAQSDAAVLRQFGQPMRLYAYRDRQALAAGRDGAPVDRIVLRVGECGIVAIGGAGTNEPTLRGYLDRTPFARIQRLADG